MNTPPNILTPKQSERLMQVLDLLAEHHLAIFFAGGPYGFGITNVQHGTYRMVINLWEIIMGFLDSSDSPEAFAQSIVFMAPGKIDE